MVQRHPTVEEAAVGKIIKVILSTEPAIRQASASSSRIKAPIQAIAQEGR
jgi:hypothetical protein